MSVQMCSEGSVALYGLMSSHNANWKLSNATAMCQTQSMQSTFHLKLFTLQLDRVILFYKIHFFIASI